MSIDIRQFLQTFFDESFEGLDTMEAGLLSLDVGNADPEAVNTIFRSAHSIKGGSGTFGFSEVASYTHLVETVLSQMRSRERQVSQELVNALLEAVDCLRALLAAVRDATEIDTVATTESRARLEMILKLENQRHTGCTNVAEPMDGRERPNAHADAATSSSQVQTWQIHFKPFRQMLLRGNDAVLMLRELSKLGELQVQLDYSALPALHDMDPEQCYLSWRLILNSTAEKKNVTDLFEWVEDECELVVEPHCTTAENCESTRCEPAAEQVPAPAVTAPAASAKPSGAGTEASSIRVDIEKVDDVINLVGELVITQSMLGQVGEEFQHLQTNTACLEKLREGLAQLERNTRQLQESVMRIRMVPISHVFSRFPRLVRDIGQKLGKKVRLTVSGDQTELDKTVMEKIGDPLVHLVRNAVDHGVELPHIRKAAGKDETGTVHLDAYHKGGNIVIEISDDGAGINKEKVLAKAKQRGLGAHLDLSNEDQIFDLLFEPGFSTAETVSDISGRGVGMDVVRRNIKALGGAVEISSKLNQGTRFTIRLPLTLSILDGQLVRVGEDCFVIPLIAIVESLQIQSKFVNAIAGRAEVYLLRDVYIPILRLLDIFKGRGKTQEGARQLMVVVEAEGKRVGIIVDDLLAQQQVVVKSLESNFRHVAGVSGATILGDGTVALILDVAELIQFCAGHPNPASKVA